MFGLSSIKLVGILVIFIIILGLVSSTLYYKNKVSEQQVGIAVLNANIKTITHANVSLKTHIKDTKHQTDIYIDTLAVQASNNEKLNAELAKQTSKLARHNLSSMKNGRHRELVLKIINKSVLKTTNKWSSQ